MDDLKKNKKKKKIDQKREKLRKQFAQEDIDTANSASATKLKDGGTAGFDPMNLKSSNFKKY